MKKLITIIAIIFVSINAHAQQAKPTEYNYQKRSLFEVLPIYKNDIVFLGNSITDGCEWAELFGNKRIKNRGISADRTYFMLERLDPIISGKPKKLFLQIGTNDLGAGNTPESVAENIERIVDRFLTESPRTKIYIQSIFPVNNNFEKYAKRQGSKDAEIVKTNNYLKELCARKNITYIDVYSSLVDSNGKLNAEYTNDGLHLMGKAYLVWKKVLEPYL